MIPLCNILVVVALISVMSDYSQRYVGCTFVREGVMMGFGFMCEHSRVLEV